jgi:small subunit ribosomal protein S9
MNFITSLVFQESWCNIKIGKRKRAVARVSLLPGSGELIINKIPGEQYLQYNNNYITTVRAPLEKLKLENKFNIRAIVKGGGLAGQTDAIQLGIARLLSKDNKINRKKLKVEGFLTRDSRIKERKKYGLRKARKAPQYSKR